MTMGMATMVGGASTMTTADCARGTVATLAGVLKGHLALWAWSPCFGSPVSIRRGPVVDGDVRHTRHRADQYESMTRKQSRTLAAVFFVVVVAACAALVVGARSGGGGSSKPQGVASCEDDDDDFETSSLDTTTAQFRGPVAFADLSSAGVASDGNRLVVTTESDAAQIANDALQPSASRQVELFYGDAPRDFYAVTIDVFARTATLSRSGREVGPIARTEINDVTATAELSLDDLPLLRSEFKWRARSEGSVLLGGVPVHAIDVCPGRGQSEQLLTFASSPSPIARAQRGGGQTGEPSSTITVHAVVGLEGSGGGHGRTVDPGPDCEGASGCAYDNGIDFEELREDIVEGVRHKLLDVPEVDCDRPNDLPPNRVRVGGTLWCVFDVSTGLFAEVKVEVRRDGGWDWQVVRVTGD